MIHGENAYSCYFSKDAFEKLIGDIKELMIIPNTVHMDLYDKLDNNSLIKKNNYLKII